MCHLCGKAGGEYPIEVELPFSEFRDLTVEGRIHEDCLVRLRALARHVDTMADRRESFDELFFDGVVPQVRVYYRSEGP